MTPFNKQPGEKKKQQQTNKATKRQAYKQATKNNYITMPPKAQQQTAQSPARRPRKSLDDIQILSGLTDSLRSTQECGVLVRVIQESKASTSTLRGLMRIQADSFLPRLTRHGSGRLASRPRTGSETRSATPLPLSCGARYPYQQPNCLFPTKKTS